MQRLRIKQVLCKHCTYFDILYVLDVQKISKVGPIPNLHVNAIIQANMY